MTEHTVQLPLSEDFVRGLSLGDRVYITGTIVTARDKAHLFLLNEDEQLDLNLEGGVLYHCGPIVFSDRVVSAGPTTSARLSKYEADVITKYGVRAVIGKGGMDKKTLDAFSEQGCVYLAATGGAGALLAGSIEKVVGVHKLEEFGMAEAIWVLKVKDFPTLVTMDANGNSLHSKVQEESRIVYDKLMKG